jgi:hypothetical protein
LITGSACEAVARPSDVLSVAGSTAVDHSTSVVENNATVGIHVVTTLTRQSNKSPDGQNNGLGEDPSVDQRRTGLWKSTEEAELRRLVGIHTGTRGTISWVKVAEAWNLLKLSSRTKASLSSKWREIKSRTTMLDSATIQDSTSNKPGLGVMSPTNVQQHQSIKTPQVKHQAEAKESTNRTTTSAPVDNSSLPIRLQNCSTETITSVFKKNLKKARKIGFQIYRKAPRRVSGQHITPIISTVDRLMREEMERKMNGKPSWNQLSVLVYAGAMTVDELGNQSLTEMKNRSKEWFAASYKEVDTLRRTIGKATSELNRRKQLAEVAPTDRQLSNIRLLKKKYKCRTSVEITSLVEILKCRLQHLLSRIALRKANEQRSFVRNSPLKMVFRDRESKELTNTTDVHQIRRYWKSIVGVKKSFDHQNPLLVAWKQALPEHPDEDNLDEHLSLDLWQRVVRKLKPWKASGPDGLQGFWWKIFATANKSLYRLVHLHLTSGAPLPQGWISDGRIVLIHKSGSRSDPSNFRPIACLNTCYKLLTGFVTAYLDKYVTERNLFIGEQRALQKSAWGCTHALLLDQTLIADAQDQKQRPISVGWIDYAKAFDSVPHSYIQWLLEAMRVPIPLRKFLKGLMKKWRVKYEVKNPGGKIERSSFLQIRSGVLQGDSFSPLLFCLAMAPISHALNNTKCHYTTASGKLNKMQLSMSHQFYMDDLKLYANSQENLYVLFRVVKSISAAISMKINSKKCAVAHFIPKRLRTVNGVDQPTDNGKIPVLEGGLHYKYLGMDQELGMKQSITWDRVVEKCITKFRRVWTSDLTFRQKVEAHNTTIIPALNYVSSNTIKGGGKFDAQLFKGEQLDKKLRKILKEEKARQKASAVSRLYLPSEKGGIGLKSVRDSIEESTIYTWAYLCTRVDLKPTYALFEKMANRGKRSVISDARHVLKTYNIEVEVDVTTPSVLLEEVRYVNPSLLAQRVVELMRNANNIRRYQEWENLQLAGRVLRSIQEIDLTISFEWLRKGWLSSINVRNALAVQEGCLLTKNHPANDNNTDRNCRMCSGPLETIEHVVSCCPKWLSTLYIDRHDSVARHIYNTLCRQYDLLPPHYLQKIDPVVENNAVKLYWNQPVQTRATIHHHKPDLIAFDKTRKTALIIEVAVSWFTGIEKSIELKRNRYCVNGNWEDELNFPYPRGDNLFKELCTEGWKVTFVPVVIGATGEVLSGFKEQIKEGLGLNWQASLKLIEKLQRSAVLGTSRIVRNHLST